MFSPLIEILTIFVLHTLISVPSVYQNVTELHRQLSICNCSSTTEYFRSINDAFERIHNVVSLKFRFSNDSDNINMITQYGEKIKSVTNVKFKLRTPHANPTIDCFALSFFTFPPFTLIVNLNNPLGAFQHIKEIAFFAMTTRHYIEDFGNKQQ